MKDLDALPALTDLRDTKQAATYFGGAKAVAEKQQAQLAALRPAAGVRASYRAFLAGTGQATKLVGATYAAARSGDAALEARTARRLASAISASDRAAARLGMKVCGGS